MQTALNTYRKKAFVGAMIYRSSGSGAQSFAAADGTLTFTTALYDTGTFWSAGTPSRITFPTTGNYAMRFFGQVGGTLAGSYQYALRRSGSTTVFSAATPTAFLGGNNSSAAPGFQVWNFPAGDYVEFFWLHGTSSTITTTINSSGIITPGSNDNYGFIEVYNVGA